MKRRFHILRHKKWFFLLSTVITLAGVIVFAMRGLNLGQDFKAGSRIQAQGSLSTGQVEHVFAKTGVRVSGDEITYGGSAGNHITIIRLPTVLNQSTQAQIRETWHGTQIDTVDPVEAQLLSHKAILAVLLASLFTLVYVSIRFEYRYAVAAVLALLHDAFIVMAVFALFHLAVNLLFVTAILTIVGYSINDTIVIFDRIRENQKQHPPTTLAQLEEITELSLWQTMSRSINTVTTVLMAALLLFIFGGPTIHNFTLALVIGLISGAYSSIFIASPIWMVWRGRTFPRDT